MLYEVQCISEDCSENSKLLEMLLSVTEDIPACTVCGQNLVKMISAPKGIVRGSRNPCNGQFRNH